MNKNVIDNTDKHFYYAKLFLSHKQESKHIACQERD